MFHGLILSVSENPTVFSFLSEPMSVQPVFKKTFDDGFSQVTARALISTPTNKHSEGQNPGGLLPSSQNLSGLKPEEPGGTTPAIMCGDLTQSARSPVH